MLGALHENTKERYRLTNNRSCEFMHPDGVVVERSREIYAAPGLKWMCRRSASSNFPRSVCD